MKFKDAIWMLRTQVEEFSEDILQDLSETPEVDIYDEDWPAEVWQRRFYEFITRKD